MAQDRITIAQALATAGKLRAAGDLKGAEQLCRRVLAATPVNADACNLLSSLALRRGDATAAAEWITQALAVRPDVAAHRANEARILLSLSRRSEAIASWRRAIALDPESADFPFQLGNLLLEDRRSGEAAASYRQTITLQPDHAAAHCNLGVALKQQGKIEEAIGSYRIPSRSTLEWPMPLSTSAACCRVSGAMTRSSSVSRKR